MTAAGVRTGRGRRVARAAFAVVALIGVAAAGVAFIVAGLTPTPPEAAPIPEPFVHAVGQPLPDPEPAPGDPLPADALLIDSLGISAPLLPGAVSNQSLRIPSDPAKLTLYSGGAGPCDPEGTVLLAGHVSSYGVHGALWPLHKIQPGATAFVTCADGTVTAWQAVSVQVEHKDDLPQDVFSDTGDLRLVIVTCGGPVMSNGHYRDNVIVTFAPVVTSPI